MTEVQKFCSYCRRFLADVGFKTVLHIRSGSRRYQCANCQEIRKKPRAELEQRAQEDVVARRAAQSAAAKAAAERKLKDEQ